MGRIVDNIGGRLRVGRHLSGRCEPGFAGRNASRPTRQQRQHSSGGPEIFLAWTHGSFDEGRRIRYG